jgi:hypothetical protein
MQEFEKRIHQHECDFMGGGVPPTPTMEAFLESLVARFPDDVEVEAPENPWAFMPVRDCVQGAVGYFNVVWDSADDVVNGLPEIAHAHGLVCFDP